MADVMWQLRATCRVRQERFGLLFYDSRGPKLLFAETGQSLPAEFFGNDGCQAQYLATLGERERARVNGFLKQLVQKGFLHEQPIC